MTPLQLAALLVTAIAYIAVFRQLRRWHRADRLRRAATEQHRRDTAFVRAVAPSISTPVPRAPMKFKGAR